MSPANVTDRTREKEPPEHVRSLRWEIDGRHSLMFNDYGSIDLCDNQRHGAANRIAIADAKRYGAALLAAVAAYEQAENPVEVKVTNWLLKNCIKAAEEAARRSEEATQRLEEALGQAKQYHDDTTFQGRE